MRREAEGRRGKSDLSQLFSVIWAKAQFCDWPLVCASCPLSLPSLGEADGPGVEKPCVFGEDRIGKVVRLNQV